ncbi:MAG: hypothetical protein EA349_01655 [Halomonadaceae bacterium]|nr:MAG: hypothetical protein EA349_01655 [Halomonadaceae bacterium]
MTWTVGATKIAELARQMLIITRRLPLTGTYSRIDELKALFQSIQSEYGDHILEAAARCLLLKMTDGTYWMPPCQVPDSIRSQVVHHRERIHQEALVKPLGHYHPLKDLFLQDFSLLRGKTLPLECSILDTLVVLWRRPLTSRSLVQRLQFLGLLLRKPVGKGYFLQLHLHPGMLDNFSETGWTKNYFMVCDFLLINPGYKGLTGTSWFYDPAIEHINPDLSYLSREPLKGGAKRYLAGSDTSCNLPCLPPAQSNSQGKAPYSPQNYMLVWPRKSLLTWRKQQTKPPLARLGVYRPKG